MRAVRANRRRPLELGNCPQPTFEEFGFAGPVAGLPA